MWEWFSSETAKQTVAYSLFGTLITAAFGAFAGAFLASRNRYKSELIAELNSIKATLLLCFTMCNSFISQKKMILPLCHMYQEHRRLYGQTLSVFQAELQTITPVKLPNELLERQIFEKIRIQHRGLAAAVYLLGVTDALEKSITYRNDLIAEFKATEFPSHKEKGEMYFGLRNADGVIDERFQSNLAALARQIDDCIFFSRLFADDLLTYGNNLIRRHRWRYRLGIGESTAVDWSEVEKGGVMPAREDYAGWLNAFRGKQATDRLAWMGKPGTGPVLLTIIALFAAGVGFSWSIAWERMRLPNHPLPMGPNKKTPGKTDRGQE
jgi:hypothetical protein